jgi:hypothetical protein
MKQKKHNFLFAALLALIFLSEQINSFAQARLVLGNGTAVYLNISGGAYLVVGDATASANPNTITRAANAWIISEGDGTTNNRIKWFIGSAATSTTYIVPFGRSTTNYIPLTLAIGTTTGTAGGAFVFSTYRTTNCTNSGNLPTTGSNPPTNYTSPSIPGDASNYGVDRFWEIDGSSYGANKPDLSSLIFTYIQAEVDGISCSNTGISETTIQAQRWNSTTTVPGWQGPSNTFIKGTSTPASDIVTLTGATVVSGIDDVATSRWWALQDNVKPLPVTWLTQLATCNNESAIIKWSTASEQNANFFTVERSLDGASFITIGKVLASGNSSNVKNYSFIDTEPYSEISYYRIRETDFNSSSMLSEMMTVNGCSNNNIIISGGNGCISVNIDATEDSKYAFEIYNAIGQKLLNEVKSISAGNNLLKLSGSNMTSAMYVVKVYSNRKMSTQKVFVRSEYAQ